MGQIVILNGAPRSGKSSIARVIQERWPGVWMNLGVDGFMAMTPPRILPGIGLRPGGERPDLEEVIPSLYVALFHSIAAHSRLGINVVADFGIHDSYSQSLNIRRSCREALSGLPLLWVGVRCSAEVLMERRRATGWDTPPEGDPIPGPILLWQEMMDQGLDEDLAVNTDSMSPEEAAEAIWRRLVQNPLSPLGNISP